MNIIMSPSSSAKTSTGNIPSNPALLPSTSISDADFRFYVHHFYRQLLLRRQPKLMAHELEALSTRLQNEYNLPMAADSFLRNALQDRGATAGSKKRTVAVPKALWADMLPLVNEVLGLSAGWEEVKPASDEPWNIVVMPPEEPWDVIGPDG